MIFLNKKYSLILFLVFLQIPNSVLVAQEIDFGTYSSTYSVTVQELDGTILDFGLLYNNEGLISIDIEDALVYSIEAVEYMDIIIDISADLNLETAGCVTSSCQIPFTLNAAYANRGQNNIAQAIAMNISSNGASAQFPVKYRGNAPPGPPPTPVYEGYNPNNYTDTAYLYIYGSINVPIVDAGSYSGQISISVIYD